MFGKKEMLYFYNINFTTGTTCTTLHSTCGTRTTLHVVRVVYAPLCIIWLDSSYTSTHSQLEPAWNLRHSSSHWIDCTGRKVDENSQQLDPNFYISLHLSDLSDESNGAFTWWGSHHASHAALLFPFPRIINRVWCVLPGISTDLLGELMSRSAASRGSCQCCSTATQGKRPSQSNVQQERLLVALFTLYVTWPLMMQML